MALWAILIQLGRHDSYETPPQIPLITGGSKPKKKSLSEAFAGAASAIANAFHPPAVSRNFTVHVVQSFIKGHKNLE